MTIHDIAELDGIWDFSIGQELVGTPPDLRLLGVMKNGALHGFDRLGGSWIVLVTWLEEDEIGYLATVELRHANAGVTMPNGRGKRVRDKVEYRGTLRAALGDDGVSLTGDLEMGRSHVPVRARKRMGFND